MIRLPDWETRFHEVIERSRDRRFRVGRHDCCTFAAEMVEALTGLNPLIDVMNLWPTRSTMCAGLTAVGSLDRAVSIILGNPMVNPLFMQRGDVVLINRLEPQLAVCAGVHLIAPSKSGLISQSMDQAVLAWGIGHG